MNVTRLSPRRLNILAQLVRRTACGRTPSTTSGGASPPRAKTECAPARWSHQAPGAQRMTMPSRCAAARWARVKRDAGLAEAVRGTNDFQPAAFLPEGAAAPPRRGRVALQSPQLLGIGYGIPDQSGALHHQPARHRRCGGGRTGHRGFRRRTGRSTASRGRARCPGWRRNAAPLSLDENELETMPWSPWANACRAMQARGTGLSPPSASRPTAIAWART